MAERPRHYKVGRGGARYFVVYVRMNERELAGLDRIAKEIRSTRSAVVRYLVGLEAEALRKCREWSKVLP